MRLIIPIAIFCPHCGARHVDTDECAHTTHRCQACAREFDVYVSGMPGNGHPEPDICCKCLIVFKASSEVFTDGNGDVYCSKCAPVNERINIAPKRCLRCDKVFKHGDVKFTIGGKGDYCSKCAEPNSEVCCKTCYNYTLNMDGICAKCTFE